MPENKGGRWTRPLFLFVLAEIGSAGRVHGHDDVEELFVSQPEGADGAGTVGLGGLEYDLLLIDLTEYGDQIADVEVDFEVVSFNHRIQLILAVAHFGAAGCEVEVADAAVAVGLNLKADDVGVVAGEKLGDAHGLEEGIGADYRACIVALGNDGPVVGGSGRRSTG